jgi:23S rRNA (adenine1618-N6)-methyltransferase
LIGASAYGWSFIATECDEESAGSATRILRDNMSNGQGSVPLSGIEIRRQGDPGSILMGGVLGETEEVDFTMCNPPFYESERAFREANARKIDKLAANVRKRVGSGKGGSNSDRRVEKERKKDAVSGSNNFGGDASELWCAGGEVSFVQRLAKESAAYSQQCLWFSSLVSQVPLPLPAPPCIHYLQSCV